MASHFATTYSSHFLGHQSKLGAANSQAKVKTKRKRTHQPNKHIFSQEDSRRYHRIWHPPSLAGAFSGKFFSSSPYIPIEIRRSKNKGQAPKSRSNAITKANRTTSYPVTSADNGFVPVQLDDYEERYKFGHDGGHLPERPAMARSVSHAQLTTQPALQQQGHLHHHHHHHDQSPSLDYHESSVNQSSSSYVTSPPMYTSQFKGKVQSHVRQQNPLARSISSSDLTGRSSGRRSRPASASVRRRNNDRRPQSSRPPSASISARRQGQRKEQVIPGSYEAWVSNVTRGTPNNINMRSMNQAARYKSKYGASVSMEGKQQASQKSEIKKKKKRRRKKKRTVIPNSLTNSRYGPRPFSASYSHSRPSTAGLPTKINPKESTTFRIFGLDYDSDESYYTDDDNGSYYDPTPRQSLSRQWV